MRMRITRKRKEFGTENVSLIEKDAGELYTDYKAVKNSAFSF